MERAALALTPSPQIKRATFAQLTARQLYGLLALRAAVFVVEQDCVYLDPDGRDTEPATLHLWVEDAQVPVAALRILEDGTGSSIGRVVTVPSHRRQGLAASLVTAALAEPAARRPVFINAQSQLEQWYAALGFRRCGDEFMEDGIPHVPMRLIGEALPR